MKRTDISPQLKSVLGCAAQIAKDVQAQAIVLLAELPYDFAEIRRRLEKNRLVVASGDLDLQRIIREDGVDLVPLNLEPEVRRLQLGQALLEAIADELLQSGDTVVALYPGFELHDVDTISIINLGEHLARLTSRDLQRLETQVPLETLRSVVDLAVEIGREGREGKPVGTLFVVGNHRKVLKLSHEQVHDPFRGYPVRERQIRDARVRESMKEIAQLDGGFIISSDGIVHSAGRNIDAPATGVNLSKGLGSRHWAAAAISRVTKAIAIAVSESTGTVRLFQDGRVVLRIEPMDRAMKWQNFENDLMSAGD
jgi:DNA integrity scanning protein DisA with diadenylate cyclase activity